MVASGKFNNPAARILPLVCALACASCAGQPANGPAHEAHTGTRNADFVNSKLFAVIPNADSGDELRMRIERGDSKVDLEKVFWSTSVKEGDLNALSSPQARKNVRILYGNKLELTDANIAPMRRLQLEELDLSNNRLRNLEVIEQMKSLKKLSLTNCPLNSQGVAVIAGLPNLETLFLNGTPISDSDLLVLSGCERLEELSVMGCTRITQAGLDKFKKLLPKCSVHNFWGKGSIRTTIPWYIIQQKIVAGQYTEGDAMLLKFMNESKPKSSQDWTDIVKILELRAACQLNTGHKDVADKLLAQAIAICKTHCPQLLEEEQKRTAQIRRTASGRK